MRLAAFTRASLRTQMYLAVNAGRHTAIAEIVRTSRIFDACLTKVARLPGSPGDIETVRGNDGGRRLAPAPDSISLGAIIRRTEANMDLVACFAAAESCPIGELCLPHAISQNVRASFLPVIAGIRPPARSRRDSDSPDCRGSERHDGP